MGILFKQYIIELNIRIKTVRYSSWACIWHINKGNIGSQIWGATWKAEFIFACTSKTERWFDLCGSFDLPIEEFFTRPPCSSLRGHYRPFRVKAAFSVRIVGPWNRQPASVVEAPTANVFKSRFDAFWTNVLPGVICYSTTPVFPKIWLTWFFLR